MEYIDVTIRESVYLKHGMNEERACEYLKRYVDLMPFPEVTSVEICFLDNNEKGTLLYDENYIKTAHEIVKGKYNLIAVIHPSLVDIDNWNPEVIKLFKTVRFMINTPIDKHTEDIMDYLHKLNVEVSLNVIYISKKDDLFVEECLKIAQKHNVEYFTFADSCGHCLPKDVQHNIEFIKLRDSKIQLNYHLHDHFGMALANATSIYFDLDRIDCSAHGIGKGGGNLSLESIVFASRQMRGIRVTSDEVVKYAKLLRYLVKDIYMENWEVVEEDFKNLLVGVCNCNLKEVALVEKEAGNDFLKYCEVICNLKKGL